MRKRDEFDGSRGMPDVKGAIGSIFGALDKRDRMEPRGPLWAVAIVGTLVIFLGAVLWVSYPREKAQREIMAVPIIRADAGPIKVIPQDPGGMDIPHRDSTIYDTLHASADGEPDHHVEHLLSDPEEPVDRDKLFASLGEVRVEGREVKKAPEKAAEPVAPVTVAKAAPAPEKQPDVKNETVASAQPAVPRSKPVRDIAEEVSRTEPAAGVETFDNADTAYFIQLGALRSDAAAQAAWSDLQKSLSVLSDAGHRVQRADLGVQGVYYRLQAGPFAEARARALCAAVEKQRPGGCLVIKD